MASVVTETVMLSSVPAIAGRSGKFQPTALTFCRDCGPGLPRGPTTLPPRPSAPYNTQTRERNRKQPEASRFRGWDINGGNHGAYAYPLQYVRDHVGFVATRRRYRDVVRR